MGQVIIIAIGTLVCVGGLWLIKEYSNNNLND